MPTIPLSAGIKMIEDFENCERRVAAMQKRRKPVRKILCSVLIGFAIVVIAILAIPAGLFLGAIACVWNITDKIVQIIDT